MDSDLTFHARHKRATREAILDAVERCLERGGLDELTFLQIAQEAGVSDRTVYRHFATKDAILDEVLDEGLRRVFNGVKLKLKNAGDVSHRRKIALAIEAHLVALHDASDFTSANIRIYGQLPERLKGPHRAIRRAYARYWDRLLSDAQKAGEIRADIELIPLRIFVIGALNWTVEWFDLSKKDAVQKLARRTESIIFDGVKR